MTCALIPFHSQKGALQILEGAQMSTFQILIKELTNVTFSLITIVAKFYIWQASVKTGSFGMPFHLMKIVLGMQQLLCRGD